MATRLLHLMPRLRRVLLGDGHQASFNRVRDIPRSCAMRHCRVSELPFKLNVLNLVV